MYLQFHFSILLFCLVWYQCCYGQETCKCVYDGTKNLCQTSETDFNCLLSNFGVCPCSLITDETECEANGGLKLCANLIDRSFTDYCDCKRGPGQACNVDFGGPRGGCTAGLICPCDYYYSRCGNGYYCWTYARAAAIGDPHFNGFDGSKFDFHGVHTHNYLVFAERNGDRLVAKVRATNELYHGINKTYFYEFGLQTQADSSMQDKPTSTHQIHVFLRDQNNGKRTMYVTVNKKRVILDSSFNQLKISFSTDRNTVTVTSMKNKFIISSVSVKSKYRHHLDFKISLGKVRGPGDYEGVLGMTMSRKLGSPVHEKVIVGKNKLDFEMAMRKHYETVSLFPKGDDIKQFYYY